jgi:organic hydroperoxide reductase OsmC/OhrA
MPANPLTKVLYTAEATVQGGRAGHGRTADAADLMARADRRCPYSNATRGNIQVTLSVDGAPLARAAA